MWRFARGVCKQHNRLVHLLAELSADDQGLTDLQRVGESLGHVWTGLDGLFQLVESACFKCNAYSLLKLAICKAPAAGKQSRCKPMRGSTADYLT